MEANRGPFRKFSSTLMAGCYILQTATNAEELNFAVVPSHHGGNNPEVGPEPGSNLYSR